MTDISRSSTRITSDDSLGLQSNSQLVEYVEQLLFSTESGTSGLFYNCIFL